MCARVFTSEGAHNDVAAQLGVGGLPDLAHPALADESSDVVVPEAGAGGQGHGGLERSIIPRQG